MIPSDAVSAILDEMPPDPTNLEDMVHSALFGGRPLEALKHASLSDPWLAAHLADIMELIGLIDSTPDDE